VSSAFAGVAALAITTVVPQASAAPVQVKMRIKRDGGNLFMAPPLPGGWQ
jgi:hypothetical protein